MLSKHPIEDIYAEAKAYALKGTLLDRTFIESLASARSVKEIAEKLTSTPYSKVIRRPEEVDSARKLESLLRAALALDYYRLGKWFRHSNMLTAYFRKLLGWDLKMVLRAVHQGKSFEEIMDLLYLKAEEILGRRELLVKILASSTIDEGIALLEGDPFYEPLRRALKIYKEKGDPTIFDLYIDKVVYSEIAGSVMKEKKLRKGISVNRHFWEFVELDLLRYNLTCILRGKILGLQQSEINELLVDFGKMETLKKVIEARNVEEVWRYVKRLGLKGTLKANTIESILQKLEEETRSKELSLARSSFYRKVMTPSVVLAYLKLKEREIEHISKVALGVELGLPREEILSSF